MKYLLHHLILVMLMATSCTAQRPASPGVTSMSLSPTRTPEQAKDCTPKTDELTRDLAVHRQAMRAGFEGDVDQLVTHPYYWLTLTLTNDPPQVEGTERVHYCNVESEAIQDIVFRLYPNTLLNETILKIGRVEAEGQPVNTVLEVGDSVLRVPLAHELLPGQVVVIDLTFTLELPTDLAEVGFGRLAHLEGITLLSSFFPLLSVYEHSKWWLDWPDQKGDPVYSEIAFFDVTLNAPAALQVAGSGLTLESTPTDKNTVTHRLVSGPVRDFSLAVSSDFELLSRVQDGVTVNIWSMPGSHEADLIALESTIAALEIFDEQFGAYPFSEFDVVEAPVSALGIEYPGLTDIASRIWRDDDATLERVIAHEVAHQWWYSMVGNDQVGEPWLDEGLAEYSVELFYRERQGLQGAQAVRDYFQTEVNSYLSDRDRRLPVGLPVNAYNGGEYRAFVYSKGGLFYGQLQDQYGLEKVQGFLQAYYGQYRYRVVHNADLEYMIGGFFGPEARELFVDWVYG